MNGSSIYIKNLKIYISLKTCFTNIHSINYLYICSVNYVIMGICNKNQQNFTLTINRNTPKAEREK